MGAGALTRRRHRASLLSGTAQGQNRFLGRKMRRSSPKTLALSNLYKPDAKRPKQLGREAGRGKLTRDRRGRVSARSRAGSLEPISMRLFYGAAKARPSGRRYPRPISHRPVGLGGIDGDQPIIEISAEVAIAVIERAPRVVAHELGYGGLDFGLEDLGRQIGRPA